MKQLSKFIIIFAVFLGSFLTPLQVIFTPSTASEKQNVLADISNINIEIIQLEAYALDGPDSGSASNDYFVCSWYELHCWAMDLLYIIAVPLGNALVALAGMVLDFFMLHSISSTSYRSGFIEAGWEILRDITNIFFLFALLILAFKMVLGMGDSKKSLINIIVIALTINFSLFMSYLIIDTSNIFAHVFYNKITASEINQESGETTTENIAGTTDGTSSSTSTVEEFTVTETESRSLAIADKIDPQKLTSAIPAGSSRLLKLVVVVVAGIINYTIIGVFLSVALLMLGRTVGLFVTVVLAPLAFTSIIIPKLKDVPYVGFSNWIKDLFKLSFMAPVFLFFLYLTVQFINIGVPTSETDGGVFKDLLNVLIPMIAVLTLIILSKKVATEMSGKIGSLTSETFSKVVSGVGKAGKIALGGAAIGVTAAAAIGGGAAGLASKATGGRIGRKTSRMLADTKFDMTKIPGFKKVMGDKATKNIAKFTGRSAAGKVEGFHKWRTTPFSGLKNERADIEDSKLERAKKAAKAKADRDKYNDSSKFGARDATARAEAAKNMEKWQQGLHESAAADELQDRKDAVSEKSENGKPSLKKELDDALIARNNADPEVLKAQKQQTETLESILKATKENAAKMVAEFVPGPNMSKAQADTERRRLRKEGEERVEKSQGELKSYINNNSFEGKVQNAQNNLDKAVEKEINAYADEIDESGENGGSKTAQKIRTGKIKPTEDMKENKGKKKKGKKRKKEKTDDKGE